ncbi:MAG: anhydro-N-acetylmuramic acid kinase [Candidatus Sericytochromatia bacterium]
MYPLLKVIGLMSGTSTDGLDISYVEIYNSNDKFHINPIFFKSNPYPKELKEEILKNVDLSQAKLNEISDFNFKLGNYFADKVLDFIKEFDIKEIDLIGSHGHTFYHSIKDGKAISTLQLGEPSVIAQKTGITTVADFRTADIAVNGEGAPLVPFFDRCFFHEKNIVLQNIGGISNSGYILENGDILAFDNGAGNMIIDSAMKIITNGAKDYDNNGEIASKGKVNNKFLEILLDNSYFDLKPPKSTGRELFGEHYSKEMFTKAKELNINDEDIISTLTYFVGKTISDSYNSFLPKTPEKVIISGGGAKNESIKKYLKELLPNSKILTTDDYGLNAEAKESIAFALFAYCTVFGIPNNVKSATGADKEIVMGKICPSTNYKRIILLDSQYTNIQDKSSLTLTESRNILSQELDNLSPLKIVELMNQNDYQVVESIDRAKESISKVMQNTIDVFLNGGRLFYIGAGTSGRLGVLDASECPPTFKSPHEKVQGIIAGGQIALTTAVEGAEDSAEQGIKDVQERNISDKDIIVGISANGRAKYVLEALRESKKRGAKTALITCNYFDKPEFIDEIIVISVGAEVLSGSTRLKAGTATKMVLNMITTGSFAKTGKVYGNYMVDLNVSNIKLKARAINIIKSLTNADNNKAEDYLNKANGSVKTAILMILKNINDFEIAKKLLDENNGFIRKVLE